MTKTPERVDMLKQYYDQAPEIAARIEALPERSSIYSLLRRDFIAPAVDAAERGDDELAERTYINGMQWVVNRVAVDRGKS
jgi:hypothetical protein